MTKRKRGQLQKQWMKHQAESWESRGGYKGSFCKVEAHKKNTETWRTECVGRKRKMTSEKQLPFGQNTGKEDKDMAQNIEEHSGGVRLQAGTNSIENDKETTELLPSEWINGTTMGHKEQN